MMIQFEGLTKLADTIHAGGAKGIVQLYHGGRLAVPHLIPNGETVSASNVAPLEDTEDFIASNNLLVN